MILYCDGGTNGRNTRDNANGVYCSVYDEGKAEIVTTKFYPHFATCNQAEFCAVAESIKYAETHPPQDIIIHSDSQLIVKSLRGDVKMGNRILVRMRKAIIARMLKLEHKGYSFTFVWVPRQNLVDRVGH